MHFEHTARRRVLVAALALLATVAAVLAGPAPAQAYYPHNIYFEHPGEYPTNGGWRTVVMQTGIAWDWNSQFALDVPGSTSVWSTQVQMYTSNATDAQVWRFVAAGDGYFKLQPRSNPSLCLDVLGGGSGVATPVGVYGCDPNAVNQPNQLWRPVDVGGGWYELASKVHPDRVLSGLRSTDGGTIKMIVHETGRTPELHQRFRFYNEVISKEHKVNLGANEWVNRHSNYCPHPYFLDEDGEENNEWHWNVHYNALSDSVAVRVEEDNIAAVTVWFEKRRVGPQSGGVRFYCNLDMT